MKVTVGELKQIIREVSEEVGGGRLDEALDVAKQAAAERVLDNLTLLKDTGLPKLDEAVEKARAEINSFLTKGTVGKLVTTIGGFRSDPIDRAMTMERVLKAGFKVLPSLMKTNGVDPTSEKTISNLLDDTKLSTMKKLLQGAFTQTGVLGRDKNVPYVDVKGDTGLVYEMTSLLPVKDLVALQKKIMGLKEEPAPEAKPEEKAAEKPAEAPAPEEKAAPTAAPAKVDINQLTKDLKAQGLEMGYNDVRNVLRAAARAGRLK